jgi:membrane protein required for colicin V production
MTWLDYAVLGVMAASILWGAWRGLVREVISLAGWVIAFLAANLFAGPLGEVLPQSISRPELRILAAYVGVFVAALLVTKLFGLLLSKVVQAIGLGGLDRAMGALFGLARGALVVVAFALMAGLTTLPSSPAWKNSATGAWLAACAQVLKPWLPPALTERLRYD